MESRNRIVEFSNWLLRRVYNEEICDEIEGDLLELYNIRVEEKGRRKASWLYLWETIQSFRNIGLKKNRKLPEFSINPIGMLRNLFLVALRSLKKDAVFSSINILGLTIGITCSLLLCLYIIDELSYDRYHKKSKNTYRVISHFKDASGEFTWPGAEMPLAHELRSSYPQVKNAASFRSTPEELYQYDDKRFRAEKFYMAEPQMFQIFDYTFLYGDANTALSNPQSMVLTETLAKRYFTTPEIAFGQSLKNEKGLEFKITGIIKDVPLNSHFRFNGLITENNELANDWLALGAYTYIVFPEEYPVYEFNKELQKLVKEKVAPTFDQAGLQLTHEIQSITDIHLHSKIEMEQSTSGDMLYIYTFGAIAIFLITIACINYMNLATGRSLNRVKEIGVRKVLGSQRSTLICQFLFETIILSVISLILSLALIYLLLPSFNTLTGKQLNYLYLFQPTVLLLLISLIVFIGIIGGSYPAIYLSSFNPALVLKGTFVAKGGSLFFRKSLVVTQFSISIFILFSTLVVFNQLRYMKSQPLGFDTQKVFRLDLTQQMIASRSVLMDKLKQLPDISAVAEANSTPGKPLGKLVFSLPDHAGRMKEKTLDRISTDWDFVKTMGMTISEGRDFSRDIPSDQQQGAIVNEELVKQMGWKDPIGKRIVQKLNGAAGDLNYTVIGVVKDFNQRALYNKIDPLIILFGTNNQYIFVKYDGAPQEIITSVEKTFKEVYPDHTFVYNFVDQDFNTQYKSDELRGRILTIFSMISIFISCLGLIGFTAFTIERRLKEISIRKISGASVRSLLVLLSSDFLILVLIGIAIAFPFAYYFASQWLQHFAYKIALESQWLTFGAAVIFTFLITLMTILFHVYRAATLNPVTMLKSE